MIDSMHDDTPALTRPRNRRRRRVLTSRELMANLSVARVDSRGRIWLDAPESPKRFSLWRVSVAAGGIPLLVLGALVLLPDANSATPARVDRSHSLASVASAVAREPATNAGKQISAASQKPEPTRVSECVPPDSTQSLSFGGVVVKVTEQANGAKSTVRTVIAPGEKRC